MTARGLSEGTVVGMRSGQSAGTRLWGLVAVSGCRVTSGVRWAEVSYNLLHISKGSLWMLGEE